MVHESFWDFSCRVYRRPLVSNYCLDLQNEHGLDVNLLLFAVWHARTRGLLDSATLSKAHAFSDAWSGAVVRSLRKARTWLKTNTQEMENITLIEREGMLDLREQIKVLELQAEHFQQNRLEALSTAPFEALDESTQRRAATANLLAVLSENTTRNEALEAGLNNLLNALFESPPNA